MDKEATSSISYRPMNIGDVPAVHRVETNAFASPWTMSALEQEMLANEYAYYLVAQDTEEIIGYCGAWLILDECHITNVAVLSAYRGHGIGEALMRQMMQRTARKGARTMTLEVRLSNEPALGLYRKLGFKEGGIRRGYYTDNGEDALVMWTELNEDE